MKNKEKDTILTMEDALKDNSLSHLHEAILFLESTPSSQLFPKKHETGLSYVVHKLTKELYAEHPNMPIKKVLTTIFERLTDDIPPPLMLKLTKNIINLWTVLSAENLSEKVMLRKFPMDDHGC